MKDKKIKLMNETFRADHICGKQAAIQAQAIPPASQPKR